MTSLSDGIEVVTTAEEAIGLPSPPLLIVDSLTDYMDEMGLGAGPLSWSRIGEGQSNVTFRIQREKEVFVLRRGPRPPFSKSTHNMLREARIQQLVHMAGVRVPRILALSEDTSILGVPFYIMQFIDGSIITDRVPRALDSAEARKATSAAMVDALIDLHRVDITSGEMASFGRPAGYLTRQVDRFAELWETNARREIPQFEQLRGWLESNIPETQAHSVVHGDYRMGNIMYSQKEPVSVLAVLDWEMATLGDPLADLGYLTATYAEPGSTWTPLELTTVTRGGGYYSRRDIIQRYSDASDLDLAALPWYQTLALWKAAVFCEEIYSRWLDGERPDDQTFGPSLTLGVPILLDGAAKFAGM